MYIDLSKASKPTELKCGWTLIPASQMADLAIAHGVVSVFGKIGFEAVGQFVFRLEPTRYGPDITPANVSRDVGLHFHGLLNEDQQRFEGCRIGTLLFYSSLPELLADLRHAKFTWSS